MEYDIIRVNKDNYFMFDDMVFYRGHGRHKSEEELKEEKDFNSHYTALEIQALYKKCGYVQTFGESMLMQKEW